VSEKTITTSELLDLLVSRPGEWFEAGLLLSYGVRSTHFLVYNEKKKRLFDEGCDGEVRKITPEQFAEDYEKPNAKWRVRV